jgi:hypothetical protein
MAISPEPNQPDYQVDYRHQQTAAPSRSREHKWTRSSRKNVRRKSNTGQSSHPKSGMHRRRNRRMSW